MFWRNIIENEVFRGAYDEMIPGNGEIAVLEYIKCIMSGGNLKDVPNLVYFNDGNAATKNENASLVSIHDLPIPQFEGYDLSNYAYPKLPYFSQGAVIGGNVHFVVIEM